MDYFFHRIEWQKGVVYVKQRVKRGKRPWNARGGGNGSFVCTTPAKLYLTLRNENGGSVRFNIINVVKYCNGWSKLSESRIEKLEKKLKKAVFKLDKDGYIQNLEDHITVE